MPTAPCVTAITTPVSARAEPTDRSSPPPIMSMVLKTATMPNVEAATSRLIRFSGVRKKGDATAKNTKMRA